MGISVSEEVQTQLDQVKEWMESKIGREVTYNDVIMQVLKNFQSILIPRRSWPRLRAVLAMQAPYVVLFLLQRRWHGPVRIARLSCWSIASRSAT